MVVPAINFAVCPATLHCHICSVFFQIFPEGPVWPVGIFAVLMIIIFGRYVKW